jgi:hypothetical protein
VTNPTAPAGRDERSPSHFDCSIVLTAPALLRLQAATSSDIFSGFWLRWLSFLTLAVATHDRAEDTTARMMGQDARWCPTPTLQKFVSPDLIG